MINKLIKLAKEDSFMEQIAISIEEFNDIATGRKASHYLHSCPRPAGQMELNKYKVLEEEKHRFRDLIREHFPVTRSYGYETSWAYRDFSIAYETIMRALDQGENMENNALFPDLSDDYIRELARSAHPNCEIEESASVRRAIAVGAYVQGWVWIDLDGEKPLHKPTSENLPLHKVSQTENMRNLRLVEKAVQFVRQHFYWPAFKDKDLTIADLCAQFAQRILDDNADLLRSAWAFIPPGHQLSERIRAVLEPTITSISTTVENPPNST